MTLRNKTLIVISLVLVTFSLILVFSANKLLLGGFAIVENREMENNLNRAVNAIDAETASLAAFLEDWAVWDDTYQFIANHNAEYIKKNVNTATFLSQQLHLMVLLDSAGSIVHGTVFDPDTKTFRPIHENLKSRLKSDSPLLTHKTRESTIQGLLLLSDGPMLVASRPILDSERQLPLRGTMLVGRRLNAPTLKKIADSTRLSLNVKLVSDPNLSAGFAAAARTLSSEKKIWIEPITEDIMAGYTLFQDIYGQNGLIMRLDSPRSIYLQGKRTVQYFVLLLIAFGLFFGSVNLLLLEKTILARLANLSRQVFNIGKNHTPLPRVQLNGHDELSQLAQSINSMLGSLEQTQNELMESDAATRALLDGMPDSLLRLDRQGVILDFKTSRHRIVATPSKLFSGNSIIDAYPAPLAEKMSTALAQAFASQSTQLFEQELELNNQMIHQEIRITPINEMEAIVILRDFTERKRLEQSLQFFNLRDPLTGLFNRSYWEEKITSLSQPSDKPVGIILCEVDEMRLIHDSLGPEYGNNFLMATTAALRASLPLDAIIARIGAEKFAVLVTGTNEHELSDLASKIKQEIARIGDEENNLSFSVSLGCSNSDTDSVSIRELFIAAQNRLHREKLAHSQTARKIFFQSLQTALETRDFVTHQHAERLWALGKSLSKEAGLPAKRLGNFKLLCQFHDIGKVGIPDELIFKQDRLTGEEMTQMKLHVEIGHSIAQSIPELYPIADLLLKHHEWWDGNGYPIGLREDAIPLECRIFSIVDAFDAMTNDRPDRKALSIKEAAAELRRCAGSQFDPHLVMKFLVILGVEP